MELALTEQQARSIAYDRCTFALVRISDLTAATHRDGPIFSTVVLRNGNTYHDIQNAKIARDADARKHEWTIVQILDQGCSWNGEQSQKLVLTEEQMEVLRADMEDEDEDMPDTWEETVTYGYVNMDADYIVTASRDPTAPRRLLFNPEIVYPSEKAAADAVAATKEKRKDPTAVFQMSVAFSGDGLHAHTFVNPRRRPRSLSGL
jgi:hypothetical protein